MPLPAGEFPSGQRGRAVNPLALPSEVRILSPPFLAKGEKCPQPPEAARTRAGGSVLSRRTSSPVGNTPMPGAVKRVVVAIVGVAALSCVAALAFAGGVIPGTNGCVLKSVDKRRYVAGNEAVFSTIRIPRYLREANTTTYAIAIPAMNSCFPFGENGPPYGAYVTWHVYFQDRGQRALGFDRRMLGSEWVSQLGGPHEETFRRGRASLYVQFSDEATSFAVDYRGYARTPR
jgi:hypothetical protein